MVDTFHLTELGMDSKRTHARVRSMASSPSLSLPVLKSMSPVNNASTKSTSKASAHWLQDRISSLASSTASSQPATPRNRAADRLRRIDSEVKRSVVCRHFDALFSSKREQLLPKVRSLERSPIVREELTLLQVYITSQRARYDDLRHERKRKEEVLRQALEQLEIAQIQPVDPQMLEKKVHDLESALANALNRLEKEQNYTRRLEYMREMRRGTVATAKSPIEPLRGQVRMVSMQLEGAKQNLLREAEHWRSVSDSQALQAATLTESQAHHSQSLKKRAEEYRDRSELIEFLLRLQEQKELQARLDSNEATLAAYSARVKSMEHAVTAEKELHFNERQAEEFENRLKKLLEVTGASDFLGIVDYWQYMQVNRTAIESSIEDARKKIDKMRATYQRLHDELRTMNLSINLQAPLQALRQIQEKNKLSQKALAAWYEEVCTTQYEYWEVAFKRIEECIRRIALRVMPDDKGRLEEMNIVEVLAQVESGVNALLPSN